MTKEQLIEKVQKLYALAASSNPHEANLAMQKAKDLIAKFNLEEMVNNLGKPAPIIRGEDYMPSSFKPTASCIFHFRTIIPAIVSHFDCATLVKPHNGAVSLVGTALNIELATHAIDSILNQLFAEFRETYRKIRTITFADSFWAGAAAAIVQKFGQMMLSKEMNDFMSKYSTLTQEMVVQNSEAFKIGQEAGKATELRKGVQNDDRKLLY